MREELDKLISEYNETKRCLEMGIEWLPENDFAKAKLDMLNVSFLMTLNYLSRI